MFVANRYGAGSIADSERYTVLNTAINVIFDRTIQNFRVGTHICTTSNVSTFEFAIIASLNANRGKKGRYSGEEKLKTKAKIIYQLLCTLTCRSYEPRCHTGYWIFWIRRKTCFNWGYMDEEYTIEVCRKRFFMFKWPKPAITRNISATNHARSFDNFFRWHFRQHFWKSNNIMWRVNKFGFVELVCVFRSKFLIWFFPSHDFSRSNMFLRYFAIC